MHEHVHELGMDTCVWTWAWNFARYGHVCMDMYMSMEHAGCGMGHASCGMRHRASSDGGAMDHEPCLNDDSDVPTRVPTVRAQPTRSADRPALHRSVVPDVHDDVSHPPRAARAEGVSSRLEKPNPSSVSDAPPEYGPFPKLVDTTGASSVKRRFCSPSARPTADSTTPVYARARAFGVSQRVHRAHGKVAPRASLAGWFRLGILKRLGVRRRPCRRRDKDPPLGILACRSARQQAEQSRAGRPR